MHVTSCSLQRVTSRAFGNFSQTSLSTDMVFGDDGAAHQIPTTTGSVADGYTLQLTVPT